MLYDRSLRVALRPILLWHPILLFTSPCNRTLSNTHSSLPRSRYLSSVKTVNVWRLNVILWCWNSIPTKALPPTTVLLWTPGLGRGHGKKYRSSTVAAKKISNGSIITIKDKDELCCARAVVTMKARVNHGCNSKTYKNLLHGLPVQEKMAKELHQLSSVPEGPCGIPKLEKFQPALPGYQIKDISVNPPHCIIFLAKTPSDKLSLWSKKMAITTGASPLKDSSPNPNFATSATKGTMTMLYDIIHVMENGVLPAIVKSAMTP